MGCMMIGSLGGGTGSGLTSRLVEVTLNNERKWPTTTLEGISTMSLSSQVITERTLYSISIVY